MTIAILDERKFLKSLISEGDSCEFWAIERIDHGSNRLEIRCSYGSAPRETREIITCDFEVVEEVNTSTGDEGDTSTCAVLFGGQVLEEEGLEDLEGIEFIDMSNIRVAVGGEMTFPAYSDDECDASFSGAYFICAPDDDWGARQSREWMLRALESSLESSFEQAIKLLKDMHRLGLDRQVSVSRASDLMRLALNV